MKSKSPVMDRYCVDFLERLSVVGCRHSEGLNLLDEQQLLWRLLAFLWSKPFLKKDLP